MAAQKQDDRLERTFSSYVRIQAVVLKTYLGRWTIGRIGERGSGISVLPARYYDDDIYIYIYIYLLIYYLPAFTVTRKKKPPGTRDKNMSNHHPGKKYHRTKRKKKANPVRPVEKHQEICSQLVKRKIKPTVNAAMLQLLECSTRVEPITKLT